MVGESMLKIGRIYYALFRLHHRQSISMRNVHWDANAGVQSAEACESIYDEYGVRLWWNKRLFWFKTKQDVRDISLYYICVPCGVNLRVLCVMLQKLFGIIVWKIINWGYLFHNNMHERKNDVELNGKHSIHPTLIYIWRGIFILIYMHFKNRFGFFNKPGQLSSMSIIML